MRSANDGDEIAYRRLLEALLPFLRAVVRRGFARSGFGTAMKPWPSPGISSIESDRSDMARTVVRHAMSELAHSEIPVHCEIAAITI